MLCSWNVLVACTLDPLAVLSVVSCVAGFVLYRLTPARRMS
jgi:hypothetical protein